MKLRKMATAALAGAGMLVLILDGQTALSGAAAGMELCLKTVVPSLFPFLFLCSVLTDSLWGSVFPWMRQISGKLGIPEGGESLLIAAVLGGYPAGAQAIGQAYQEGKLERTCAEHLLSFCSNAGPAFLFGITAHQFPGMSHIWALWGIQILAALITGMMDSTGGNSRTALSSGNHSVSEILTRSVKTMGVLCGWIVLFQMLSAFLSRWFFWYLPEEIQVIFTGILELSSGCCILSQIEPLWLRFLVCSGFLSFGGICVLMQTASVISSLSLKSYLSGKLKQTAISLLLSALFWMMGWPILLSAALLLIPVFRKKRSGFPTPSVV